MKQWNVYLSYSATKTVKVEAENKEDAIEKAMDESYVSLCWQCSGEIELGDIVEERCDAEEVVKP